MATRQPVAASGTSTACTGRPSTCGSRRPGGCTSRRCPAARATPATPRRCASSSASCSAGGTSWPARNALPEELYVLELGVGNGNQAKTWLDEFRVGRGGGGARLLPPPPLPHVRLLAARPRAGPGDRRRPRRPRVSSFVLDATKPTTALGLPQVQGVPRLHLQRLRQPAHGRGRPHRRPQLPGRDRGPTCPGRRPPRIEPRTSAAEVGGAARRRREAAAARARPCWPTPCRPTSPTAGDAVDFWRRSGRAAAGGALRAAGRARHLPHRAGRERRAAAARSSSPAATSACTSTTAPWPASSTRCRCCTPTAACSTTTCS